MSDMLVLAASISELAAALRDIAGGAAAAALGSESPTDKPKNTRASAKDKEADKPKKDEPEGISTDVFKKKIYEVADKYDGDVAGEILGLSTSPTTKKPATKISEVDPADYERLMEAADKKLKSASLD